MIAANSPSSLSSSRTRGGGVKGSNKSERELEEERYRTGSTSTSTSTGTSTGSGDNTGPDEGEISEMYITKCTQNILGSIAFFDLSAMKCDFLDPTLSASASESDKSAHRHNIDNSEAFGGGLPGLADLYLPTLHTAAGYVSWLVD